MLKKFYDKSIELASNKRSNLYLGLSFIESSFSYTARCNGCTHGARKKKSYIQFFNCYSLFCSWRNFGYLIGYLFIDLAMYVIEFYNYENKVLKLKMDLSQGGGMIGRYFILSWIYAFAV